MQKQFHIEIFQEYHIWVGMHKRTLANPFSFSHWNCRGVESWKLWWEDMARTMHHFNKPASFWKFVKISSHCSYENFEPRFGFSTQTLVSLHIFKLLEIMMLILWQCNAERFKKDLTVKIVQGWKLYTPSHFSQSNPLKVFKLYIAIKLTGRWLATWKLSVRRKFWC